MDDGGRLIPFLFRPYHEHSGSFFWWDRERCYDEKYAALFRYTVEYLRGYPGDAYCDMSIDWYGQGEEFNRNIKKAMDFVSETADEKGKLFALSECGPLSLDLQKTLPAYKCSYVLTWRNVPQRRPVPGGFQPRPDELLKAMKTDKHYLFFEDIKNVR